MSSQSGYGTFGVCTLAGNLDGKWALYTLGLDFGAGAMLGKARRIPGKQPHFIEEGFVSTLDVFRKRFTLPNAIISFVSQLRHTQEPG